MMDNYDDLVEAAEKAARSYRTALARGFDIGDAECHFAMKAIAVWDALRAQPTPPVQEGETPRTRAIMDLVGQLHSASGETYYALKEGAECGIANLESELEAARKEADRLTALVIERDKDRARLTAELDSMMPRPKYGDQTDKDLYQQLREAKAALATKPAAVPEGWRLVPVEPTATMKQVGDDAWRWSKGGTGVLPASRAMLAAAPEAPAVVGEQPCEHDWREFYTGSMVTHRICAKCEYKEPLSYPSPTPQAAPAAAAATAFQSRVEPWLDACFGHAIATDPVERNHRFVEEALELAQACGCTSSEAHQLVDYVWSRPIGEKTQEVGGVMVTLAALCLAWELDMAGCGEVELARIWTKVDAIRAKQAAKPAHSPLPGPTPPKE